MMRQKLQDLYQDPKTRLRLELGVICLVLVYAVVLFVGISIGDSADAEVVAAFQAVDAAFLSVFMLELVLKLFALGCKYLQDCLNLIDAIIVVVSFVVMVLEQAKVFTNANSMMLLVARMLRLVRLCRLITLAAASGGGKKTAEFTDALGTATPTAHFLPEDARREALRAARAPVRVKTASGRSAGSASSAESSISVAAEAPAPGEVAVEVDARPAPALRAAKSEAATRTAPARHVAFADATTGGAGASSNGASPQSPPRPAEVDLNAGAEVELAPNSADGARQHAHVPRALLDLIVGNAHVLMSYFREMDNDNSGTLEEAEFCKGHAKLGLTKAQAAKLFGVFDPDGSKSITLSEMNRIGQMFRQAHAEAKRASLEAPKPRESETDEQKAERLRRTLMLTSQLSVSFRLADEESTQKKKKGAAQRARKAGQWAARTAAGRLWQLKPTGAHIDLDDDDDEYVEDVDEDYESSLRSVGSAAEPSVGAASGVAVTANDVAIRIEQSKKAGRRLSTTACACAADGGRASAAAGASDAERFLSVPCYQYEARLVHSLRQLKPRLVGLQRMVLKAMKHEEELRTSHPKEARDAWELLSCHKAYLAELAAALLGVRIRCEAFEPAKLSADGVVDVKSVEQLLRVSWYRLVPTRGVQARVQRASQSLAAGLALCLVGHFTILAVLGWVGNCEALLADAAVELKAGASVGDPAAGGALATYIDNRCEGLFAASLAVRPLELVCVFAAGVFFVRNVNPKALKNLMIDPKVILILLQAMYRVAMMIMVNSTAAALALRPVPGAVYLGATKALDSLFFMIAAAIFIFMDACVVRAPLFRCMLALFLLSVLVQQYWVRRFPLTGEEEEITFSFFVWSNVSLGTTREQVQDVDFGMLLLMFAGIFSTLKKPHHLAFIRMSCDLADFLFMREQARANRKALAKDRTLHMERREQRREANRNRTSASRREPTPRNTPR